MAIQDDARQARASVPAQAWAAINAERLAPPAGVVVDCDIAREIPSIPGRGAVTEALVLVRVFSEPIGMLSRTLPAGGFAPDELAREIVRSSGPELRERLEESGLSWTGELPTDGMTPPHNPRFLETRGRVLREGPDITVAVCTRDRPDDLVRLLHSLREQEYPRMRVVVVDNAPSDDRTKRVVSAMAGKLNIDYVVEPRRGLSWARNRAIEVARTEVIAWADDDEICDPWWAAELARGFVEIPGAEAVTGLVVPAELHTHSQVWFEHYSGVGRGRGFAAGVSRRRRATAEPALSASPVRSGSQHGVSPRGARAHRGFRRRARNGTGDDGR